MPSKSFLNKTGLSRLVSKLKELINSKYTKPTAGIPASDLADGVIKDEIFVVTVVPTSETTGEMDHTIAEIHEASAAGKSFIVRVIIPGMGTTSTNACAYQQADGYSYDSLNAFALYGGGMAAIESLLTDDPGHNTVNIDFAPDWATTDVEKLQWNAKAEVGDIPTAVSELTNDSGYRTSAQVTAAINAAIGNAIGGAY